MLLMALCNTLPASQRVCGHWALREGGLNSTWMKPCERGPVNCVQGGSSAWGTICIGRGAQMRETDHSMLQLTIHSSQVDV